MKLWYFSSVLPSESTTFRALTARLAVQYGGSFQTRFLSPHASTLPANATAAPYIYLKPKQMQCCTTHWG